MCGRYTSTSSPSALAEHFHVEEVRLAETAVDYNVTPRAEMPVVAESQGRRVLDLVRWGLVPSWAKDLSIGDRLINARAESLATKPAYRKAFERRRCLVPADGFYEWQKLAGGKRKQPYYIHGRDGEPLAFAGLWEVWHDPNDDDAPRIRTFVIVTTDANATLRPLHDRMPAILPESAWDTWLDRDNHDTVALQRFLVPAPDDALVAYPVSTLVNRPQNNGAELIAPLPDDEVGAEPGAGDAAGGETLFA
jgi:putative SOS response-associated peptidase YedK